MNRLLKCVFSVILLLLSGIAVHAKGYIGITYSEFVVGTFKYPVISEIVPGSPADKAALQTGDTILAIEGAAISHYFSLKEVMDSISYSRAISFTVARSTGVVIIKINVYAPELIPIRVTRQASLKHAFLTYNIYVNGVKVDDMTWRTDVRLQVFPVYAGDDIISIYLADKDGEILLKDNRAQGATAKLFFRNGYTTVANYNCDSNKISLSFDPLPETLEMFFLDSLEMEEKSYYQRMNSDSVLAPVWFKKSLRQSLSAMDKVYRISIFNHLLQCPIVLRLLILVALLMPVVYFVNLGKDELGSYFWLLLVIALVVFLSAYVVAVILNLLLYAVSGSSSRIPHEFICLVMLSFYIVWLLYNATKGYFVFVIKSDKVIAKAVGGVGIFISWVGFISTIFYIIRLLSKIFGFYFPDFL